jgi:NitT/TauT family transport system substrate-binding protein
MAKFSRREILAGAAGLAAPMLLGRRAASARDTLTAGAVQFGTAHWLLDTIKDKKLDAADGFSLSLRMFASNAAADIGLLGKEADVVVTDWFWVMRQRGLGGDFLFMPFTAALGSVIVPPDSKIQSIADLKGKQIGVAGGPIDKSWILLRAYGIKQGVGDLAAVAQPVFGAPPLLNEQAAAGRLDALLNFWPFAARLEAKGYKRILTVSDIMRSFGIETAVPLVGFVFPAELAKSEPRLMEGFAKAVQKAQNILATSDEEWERIKPLTKASSEEEFCILRKRYREGVVHSWNGREREDAQKLFTIVKEIGGEDVTGSGVRFDPKAFWNGAVF